MTIETSLFNLPRKSKPASSRKRCGQAVLVVLALMAVSVLLGCGAAATSAPRQLSVGTTANTTSTVVSTPTSHEPPGTLTVSAAISLKDAFDELATALSKKDPGIKVTYNYASSGQLQLQIEQGAPVDVFAAAGVQQMDALDKKGLLVPNTRRDFASNMAVLVTPTSGKVALTSFADLARPEVKRVSIGDPTSVPAGSYAKQALTSLSLWETISPRIVYGENVRQVLTYVETGEVDAGIVYATDVATSRSVKIVAQAPPGSSQPIDYPIAVVASSRQRERSAAFVDFVTSAEGQAILARYGFLPAPK